MIKLYDWPNQETFDLDYSLNQAGFSGSAILINDDGFLSENIESPYGYFCGFSGKRQGYPLYFNQVPIPEYWQIIGNNHQAEVFDNDKKKATIFYTEPKQDRLVKNVDWLDSQGKVCLTEHFNQFGWRFAQTSFNTNQEVTVKSYYNASGQEIIVENFKTGDISLNWQNQVYFFKNRVEFLSFYFRERQFDTSAIWYNSLSTPFFVTRALSINEQAQDILFWQEEIGQDIPGNMKLIFDNPNDRTQKIIVQKLTAYHRLLELLPEHLHDKLSYLGYQYPLSHHEKNYQKAFILTNSDQIEGLTDLVTQLPHLEFHIAAYTEMSFRLMAFERYNNVFLYPNCPRKLVLEQLKHCGFYLDINHQNEVDLSIRKAFEEGAIILAFDQTVHNRELIINSHVFTRSQDMIDYLKDITFTKSAEKVLALQRSKANHSTVEEYRKVLVSQQEEPFANVLGIIETAKLIKEKKLSVARFGDGEIDIIAGHSIPYQKYDSDLAKKLEMILKTQSNDQLMICLPDIFKDLKRYNEPAVKFWKGHLEHYKDLYKNLLISDWYGTTFLSRPYIDLEDKRFCKLYFDALKAIWRDKDILIVEGLTSRSGVGNDLFDEARDIKRIICPSHNAFSQCDTIKKVIEKYAKDRLILLMLGPTAKVLAYELSQQGYHALDIGHIDSEYEWFQMRVDHKVKLKHKHTAEFNYDEDIILEENQSYSSQIVERITEEK